jgi:hypothetical protein
VGEVFANVVMQEREKAAEEEAEKEHDIASGNPLLNSKSDFSIKRRWDDDVVFKVFPASPLPSDNAKIIL